MKSLNSPIFGLYREPTKEEGLIINRLVFECPVRIFQTLNRRMNSKGLCIAISTLEEGELP